jgi:hypothetical protein
VGGGLHRAFSNGSGLWRWIRKEGEDDVTPPPPPPPPPTSPAGSGVGFVCG